MTCEVLIQRLWTQMDGSTRGMTDMIDRLLALLSDEQLAQLVAQMEAGE